MAGDCSWADRQFVDDPLISKVLDAQVKDAICNSHGSKYLQIVSEASLQPSCTDRALVLYRNLIPEISARWCQSSRHRSLVDDIRVLSCLSRILPFATYLRSRTRDFVRQSNLGDFLSKVACSSPDVDDERLQILLLSLFRLVSVDRDWLADLVQPVFLSSLFRHSSHPVRYLAVQCLCTLMHFADAYSKKLVHVYVTDGPIRGAWERTNIDYRLLKLFEEQRWQSLTDELTDPKHQDLPPVDTTPRFDETDLTSNTASFAGRLVPRAAPLSETRSSFARTASTRKNLRKIGNALLDNKPLWLQGRPGSGKSCLIREAARMVNKLSTMVTLYLNEQTDAKTLTGIYSSSASGGSFVWQPGVITKALQEGRWVVIEDIDRASSEVLGMLRPIIENGDLFLPNRKETIKAADGFRIFATRTVSGPPAGPLSSPNNWLFNPRLWNLVELEDLEVSELQDVLRIRLPKIQMLLQEMVAAHTSVVSTYHQDPSFRTAQSRLPTIRELLKWCRRVQRRAELLAGDPQTQGMPENFRMEMLKDALDCYTANLNDQALGMTLARCVARVLHVAPQQLEHIVQKNDFEVRQDTKQEVTVGRSTLTKATTRRSRTDQKPTFALTSVAKKTMDFVAAGVCAEEPLLFVGETGVGKTTLVQYVAQLVNRKLVVVNLSQQSEATDLLGGLKPVTTRSLIVPLVDTFSTLFEETFSSKRNEKFQVAISKAITRENWSRLIVLWQDAIALEEKSLGQSRARLSPTDENPSKRRKIEQPKYKALHGRWKDFSDRVAHIKAHMDRADKNHTFAFVEGRLVQAVREGEWLLLDEINLASSDTLDHIISLLQTGEDGRPYLLLTEAGQVEMIVAHPDFRVFAAMNPATDTGKKDLPPGVRSRFTEIYVHSGDDGITDLVKIVENYIGSELVSDHRAASDLAKAYLQLRKVNEDRKLTDGAGDVPHFSIRSVVRTLLYVRQFAPSHGLRLSMFEGFAMSFFTVLSQDSESLVRPIVTRHLLPAVKDPQSYLTRRSKLLVPDPAFVLLGHHKLVRGPFQPDLQPQYIRTPFVERNLINLARAASMRRFPILLQGPTSAGKTSMVEFLAKLSGNEFVRINNHEHTDLQEYLGSYASGDDGKLEFREGVLVQALREGHWVVLDELNLAPSDVLEALNRLLDDNRELLIPESQEIVRPHPNFMLFATQNPAGLYGGRKRLSRAFRNRFLELHFDDIPENELEIILRERARIAPSFCRQIVEVYKKLSLQRQSTRLFEQRHSFATLRDLFRWASRPMDDRQQLACHGFMLLAERVRDASERQVVKTTIEETMRVRIDESVLYGPSAIPQPLRESSHVIWTPAMRRVFVLVSTALENKEPVLLVGQTGCGKTQICQTVAEAFGKGLVIYNAHSNTETGDLIGSQRPVRHRSQLAKDLHANLSAFPSLKSRENTIETDDQDLDELIREFNGMDASGIDKDRLQQTKRSIAAYQSLFTWSDGSLVRAMKNGEHFLLDEISLADDSVLERLNSVLEPSRTILLAEKGPVDNLVVGQPDFQFLATMNPGGDYGKRELSAALRNRLTEIWVPPLSQDEDILPIITASLTDGSRKTAVSILRFALWFKDTVQNSTTSAVPLRSLLAWTKFMNTNAGLGLETSFVHGAAMVYIDSLGANPAGLTNASTADLGGIRRMCLEKLQSTLKIDVAALYSSVPALAFSREKLSVGSFSLERAAAPNVGTELILDVPTTLRNMLRIVRALQMQRPLLLEGSPGVGKTAIVTALAQAVGKPLTRINLSDQTDLMDLFGADTPATDEQIGNFSWRDGPLLQAMQSGDWVLLDEMNLASQSVLEGLNSCLDHRQQVYIAELDKTFECHPEFVLFAAQNPHHQGGGRKGLPASFVNRFTVVYADSFDYEDLLRICKGRHSDVHEAQISSIVRTISDCQTLFAESPALVSGGPWEMNLRDISRWLDLCRWLAGMDPSIHFETIVQQRLRNPAARVRAFEVYTQNFPPPPLITTYHDLAPTSLQFGHAFASRDPCLQPTESKGTVSPARHRQAQSLLTAAKLNWPVILVGPSGSGKTTLIRNIAAMCGEKVVEFSMNSDVETMDLIGGFEQYDAHRDVVDIQKRMCQMILHLLQRSLADPQTPREHSTGLLDAHTRCSQPDVSPTLVAEAVAPLVQMHAGLQDLQDEVLDIVHKSPSHEHRFVWHDGVLVEAVREGSWLVLEHANLCNASVLDRLNSLLEPNGSLVVSEQYGSSAEARKIRPHDNFRIFLTMDPRNGELSRAMRNRSLEVFLDPNEADLSPCPTPIYPTSADINRLRRLFTHLSRSRPETRSFSTMMPYLNSLSLEDVRSLASEYENNPQGFDNDVDLEVLLQARLNPVVSLSASVSDVFYKSLKYSPRSSLVVPLLNDPFLLLNSSHVGFEFSCCTARGQNLTDLFSMLRFRINEELIRLEDLKEQETTVFQKSSSGVIERRPRRREQFVPPIYQFLAKFIGMFEPFLSQSIETLLAAPLRFLYQTFSIFREFFEISCQRSLDYGHFRALIQHLSSILEDPKLAWSPFEHGIRDALATFGEQSTLQYGLSLHLMWPVWKPKTATSHTQLEAQLAVEGLLQRFAELIDVLPRPKNELAVVQSKLVDTAAAIMVHPDAIQQLDVLRTVVDELGAQQMYDTPYQSHFSAVFGSLAVKLSLQPNVVDDADTRLYALLACSKAARSYTRLENSGPPGILHKLSFLADYHRETTAGAQSSELDLSVPSLLSRLNTIVETPLSAFKDTQEGLAELAVAFSTYTDHVLADSLPVIAEDISQLLKFVLLNHLDYFHGHVRQKLHDGNDHWLSDVFRMDVGDIFEGTEPSHQYFKDVYLAHFLPSMALLTHPSGCTHEHLGSALAYICLGTMKLFVTDKTFDPSLSPRLKFNRHERQIKELTDLIKAQEQFQRSFTGDSSSLVVRMLQEDLSELGEAPEVPVVVRPCVSTLDDTQREFTNLLRSVVLADNTSQLLSGNASERQKAVQNVQRRIEITVVRLRKIDRAYDDIVKPVIWLVNSLSLALAMISRGCQGVQESSSANTSMIPLLGGSPETMVRSPIDHKRLQAVTYSDCLRITQHLAVRRLVERPNHTGEEEFVAEFCSVADSFYVQWKVGLAKDQARAESDSKYYAYRGLDDEAELENESEILEMFPTFEDVNVERENDVEADPTDSSFDAREAAIGFGIAHKKLFGSAKLQATIQNHLLSTLKSFQKGDSLTRTGKLADVLPGVFLLMQQQMSTMEGLDGTATLNVYTDWDLNESQTLVALVGDIKARFHTIAERWPEHAVPSEVLTFCKQVLGLSLNDPIAKLLTKTEKMHEIVSQWQSVASREWSVSNLVEALSSLIIRWRRLELSSWSRLLDNEKEKEENAANSWYFIAYEAIVYNSRLAVEQRGDILSYCQELARTLEEFLKATSIGQFSSRLQLLDVFSKTIEALSRDDKRLAPIDSCLSTLTSFFRRYEAKVQRSLDERRATLEKDVKEQIQLASWKDTNVLSLRESAKKSHRKLFRIVKKYRKILSEPMSVFDAAESSHDLHDEPQAEIFISEESKDNLFRALTCCQSDLAGWTSRPQRRTDPLAAAMTIHRLTTTGLDNITVATRLAEFKEDVRDSAEELRKQTPSTMTKDNTGTIRELKQQKRRLLADTVKELIQMGIRRNLGTDELNSQSTTATLLASSPDVNSAGCAALCTAVNGGFHNALDGMSDVRHALVEHSPDLTDGEVRRGVGLMEGLLWLIIQQRNGMRMANAQISQLKASTLVLNNLSDIALHNIVSAPARLTSNVEFGKLQTAWLPEILGIACQVIEFQNEHSKGNTEFIVPEMRKHAQKLRTLSSRLHALTSLPPGLCDTATLDLSQELEESLNELDQCLTLQQHQRPQIGYLVRQIRCWVRGMSENTATTNEHHSYLNIEELDAQCQRVQDLVFVAMQKMEDAIKSLQEAQEYESGWLTNAHKKLEAVVQAVRIPEITSGLAIMLSTLSQLQPGDLQLGAALAITTAPIVQQYARTCDRLFEQQLKLNLSTCNFLGFLSKSLVSLARQGFCSPPEPSKNEEQSGKLESGTGLGDGEGAEDISKDVGEDEDLSELAGAEGKQEKGGKDMEKSRDAVDMGVDDLEGEMGSEDEKDEDDDEGDGRESGDEENEIDEETGSVDDLDPSAVDEKMWDDLQNQNDKEEEKELKGDKAKGQKTDDQSAKQEGKKEEPEEGDEEADDQDDGDEEGSDTEDAQAGEKAEAENLDPRLQEKVALDLPEEMQLNGEEREVEGEVSDAELDDLSDVDKPDDDLAEAHDPGKLDQNEGDDAAALSDDEGAEAEEQENVDGEADGDDLDEEPNEEDRPDESNLLERQDENMVDLDDNAAGESGVANKQEENLDMQEDQNPQQGMNEREAAIKEDNLQSGKVTDDKKEGTGAQEIAESGVGREDGQTRPPPNDAFKKLVDVLERYHQRREILTTSEERKQEKLDQDVEMADVDFEHVQDDQDESQAQALGAANTEQAQQLDTSKAIEETDETNVNNEDLPMPDGEMSDQLDEAQETIAERFSRIQAQRQESRSDRESRNQFPEVKKPQSSFNASNLDAEALVEEENVNLDSTTHQDEDAAARETIDSAPTSHSDASQLWSTCSKRTQTLSLILTEQLRLILQPTLATKLRGDFRTGKRLNIKRIIPYIASGYKRDKIWMRRSVPSKRNYQIMIAVDDSKSMSENGADLLAFETLAMLTTSLSTLEVGSLCVVGFGEEDHIRVAHPFDRPFAGASSGTDVFRSFGFKQQGTNVKTLVRESIALFRDARLKTSAGGGGGAGGADLWQLQLILSDGHCSDHDTIRRLVRQAKEERIMMVFVMVDAGENSIVDLKEAIFERKDPLDENSEGVVRTRRYLEDFPFPYYVVVRDVADLPGTLARVLKGWFESVVDV